MLEGTGRHVPTAVTAEAAGARALPVLSGTDASLISGGIIPGGAPVITFAVAT